MNHELAQQELSFLLGQEVSFRRMAGNTLILYFGGEPGDDSVTTLSIDPSWRYARSGEWLLGSGDIPWEKEEEETGEAFSVRFNEICDICMPLFSSIVERISLSSNSADIEITFSSNQKVVSFAGYTDDYSWGFKNGLTRKRVYGSLKGYETENT